MHIPRKHYEMDMTSGPLLGKIVRFSLPLMATGVLQLLYNAADIVVVGQFAGSSALAAVGSTGALINLIVSVFMGLSTGVSVAVARHYGAGQYKDVSETVHTAVALSLICGTVVGVFGLLTASSLLQWMGTPENVLDAASLYMRILFIGMPVNMLYNFGAAVLRAVGDTRRPLIYLSISGMVNVLLNLVFVILFHMDVEGVAIATVVSQVISAVLVTMCLIRSEGSIRLFPRKIRVHVSKLWPIARIGLPAGVQGSIFSVSNVLIQSSINSFGSLAMAGNTAGGEPGRLYQHRHERLFAGRPDLQQPEHGREKAGTHPPYRPHLHGAGHGDGDSAGACAVCVRRPAAEHLRIGRKGRIFLWHDAHHLLLRVCVPVRADGFVRL